MQVISSQKKPYTVSFLSLSRVPLLFRGRQICLVGGNLLDACQKRPGDLGVSLQLNKVLSDQTLAPPGGLKRESGKSFPHSSI